MPALDSFSPDVARRLPGPPALQSRRADAAEAFHLAELPSADEEVWRYSRVADVDLSTRTPAPAPADGAVAAPAQAIRDLAAPIGPAATVVAVNGHITAVTIAPEWADRGLAVGPVDDDAALLLGSAGDPPDVFAQLNDAFAPAPLAVRTPAGLEVAAPVVVVHWFEGRSTAAFPRTLVHLGADSALSVLEVELSAADADVFVAPVVELVAGKAARLGHLAVQDLGPGVWQIASQLSRADAEATIVATAAGFGGGYARLRTDCRLAGRGATGKLRAVYFGEADQTLDFRTFQDHAAPDTTSDLLYKGAVGGRSRSVYTGLIRVRKDARGTNAFQTNRNIKLSDDAWAESVPNLQIENNDVRCSHASAVGPVDEEQRFYVESRGVPTSVAERLIVAGFFDEVFEDLPVPSAAGPLRSSINSKLDGLRGPNAIASAG
ncbi:MAG: SufB/SufD family protein [Acidimicrobiales bacterium]